MVGKYCNKPVLSIPRLTSELERAFALYQAAQAAVNAYKSAAGAQQERTQELEAVKKETYNAYQALAKVARNSRLRSWFTIVGEPNRSAGE